MAITPEALSKALDEKVQDVLGALQLQVLRLATENEALKEELAALTLTAAGTAAPAPEDSP